MVFLFMKENNSMYITKEGLEKLKEEYDHLVNNRRKKVAERIGNAREMGDLSENAEYTSAREEQGFVEGRIAELEEIFTKAKVIEKPADKNCVALGSQVTVEIESEEMTFAIVGPAEAQPAEGKISHASPVGQALIGKGVGDVAEVKLEDAVIHYRVKKIE